MTGKPDILLPTAYFPPVSYFVYLIKSSNALMEQMETYPRQTYRNRCEIMTSAGRLNLVIPVSRHAGNHTLTRDIEISYREPWNRHHWKSITTAYRSSPYFNYYADIIQPLFESKETSLLIHNLWILSIISKILKIKVSTGFTEDYIKQPEAMIDLRGAMKPGRQQQSLSFPAYPQVFRHISGFEADLSILDLLFNLGPETGKYLEMMPDFETFNLD
jgi:hypothetical protein